MRSKAIAFLCLLALVMMIASEVTARDLAETKEAERTRLEESKHDGYCHKCCHYGRCHCCKAGEKPVESVEESKLAAKEAERTRLEESKLAAKEAERTRIEESKHDGYCHKCCNYGRCHCCKAGEKPVESVPESKN